MKMAIGEKMKKGLEYIGFAIVFGSIATLISGLYHEEFVDGVVPGTFTDYGYPFKWLTKRVITATNDTLYYLSLRGLGKDVAFWSLLIGIPLTASIAALYKRYRPSKTVKATGEKLRKGLGYLGSSVGSGSIATLISGLYSRDLPRRIGLHVTAHGFPLTWVKRFVPVYPDKPTRYLLCPEGLFTDIAFWSLVVGIPLSASIAIYKRYRSRK